MQPVFGPATAGTGAAGPGGGTLRAALERAEREAIERALEASGGRVAAAAESLGVSRQHLHTLQRKHGISGGRPRRKSGPEHPQVA